MAPTIRGSVAMLSGLKPSLSATALILAGGMTRERAEQRSVPASST